MKFGQLIKYDMSNIFPEKSYTTCGGKLGHFLKKTKEIKHTSGSAIWSFLQVVFIAWPWQGLSKYIETKGETT